MNTDPLRQALTLDREGDWDGAHVIVQKTESRDAYRIHAYLHRKEPDIGNANYWYSRAGVTAPDTSLQAEWESLWAELTQS